MHDYSLDACDDPENTSPEFKPEDRMTVCIASKCGGAPPLSKRIVVITDMKASSAEGSNEIASTKSCWITTQWLALFAGNDISPCLPICTAVTMKLPDGVLSVEQVTAAFTSEYQKYLSRLAADRVLGRWNMSMEEFKATGRKNFGPDNFELLFHEIKEVRLSCQFLVCGFDAVGASHIVTVRNPGIAENQDTPGYYAIGDGAPAAMSILGFFRQNVVASVPTTYYNVCAAKYMAESSPSTVGRTTFIWELGPNGDESKTEDALAIFELTREAWKSGRPSIPQGIEESIAKVLSDRPDEQKI
jgi:hypothetical protein